MRIITKTTKSGSTKINNIVFEGSPYEKSLASYIFLKEELLFQDVDFLNDELKIWLEFREAYLNKILKKEGDLVCAYCGKKHLEIGGKNPQDLPINNKNPKLATIDHIVPLTENGPKYDEENLCVACKKCNTRKGSKSAVHFKEKISSNY